LLKVLPEDSAEKTTAVMMNPPVKQILCISGLQIY
jgi:hypothetical protein